MFLNLQIDLLILKTYYGQFTLTTKKSLHIIFNGTTVVSFLDCKDAIKKIYIYVTSHYFVPLSL